MALSHSEDNYQISCLRGSLYSAPYVAHFGWKAQLGCVFSTFKDRIYDILFTWRTWPFELCLLTKSCQRTAMTSAKLWKYVLACVVNLNIILNLMDVLSHLLSLFLVSTSDELELNMFTTRLLHSLLLRHSKRGRGRGGRETAMVAVVHDSALFPIALGPPATHYVLDHVEARNWHLASQGWSCGRFRLRVTTFEGCYAISCTGFHRLHDSYFTVERSRSNFSLWYSFSIFRFVVNFENDSFFQREHVDQAWLLCSYPADSAVSLGRFGRAENDVSVDLKIVSR